MTIVLLIVRNQLTFIDPFLIEAKVSREILKRWISLYENEGPTGLLVTLKNKFYSK